MYSKMADILTEIHNRFVLFPIRYNSIWKMYKKAVSAFWTAEEIDLSQDYADWTKLNANEQHFIKHILAFFAGSDGIVTENLAVRFMNDVKAQEAKCFYGFQIAMENVHCVSPDTEILTKDGYSPIVSLEGKVVEVWNGDVFSSVMVMKSSEGSDAYFVNLDNGMQLICTPNHEWLIEGVDHRVKTENLELGMKLKSWNYPTVDIPNDQIFSYPKKHGYKAFDMSTLYNPMGFNCRPREFVPVNYSNDIKINWLSGAFLNAKKSDDGKYYQLFNTNPKLLKHVQLMLTTMNVWSEHDRVNNFLNISIPNVSYLVSMGLEVEGFDALPCEVERKAPISIASVKKLDMKIPMYCFEEPISHTGVFNGILTGQSETYSLLLDTYIKNEDEKNYLLNAINTIPCIAKKAEWAMKWITDEKSSFALRLIAFACVEGIFFSGAFCSIFWLKERGMLPGLCLSNEFISRDESLHTEFAIHVYTLLNDQKIEQDVVHTIIREAVDIEDEFINHSISCNMLGMNSELMSQYIKYVADRLLVQLGYDKLYNESNPFQFMERISLSNKSNFFEHTRQSEYARARTGSDAERNTFGLNDEF